MNWEAIGAIGEMLAATATVAMLVYLSIQVKHAKEATQSSSEIEAAGILAQLTENISQNREMMRVWDLALQGSDALSDEDKLQYLWSISAYGNAAEGVFHQFKKGMISKETWAVWERGFTMHIGTEIGMAWWKSEAAPYSQSFRHHMTEIVESQRKPDPISSKAFLDATIDSI